MYVYKYKYSEHWKNPVDVSAKEQWWNKNR